MNADDKREFITNHMNSIRDELVKKVDQMPEEWNGHELRQLIADKTAHEVYKDVMTGRRKREFNNEVIVRNL